MIRAWAMSRATTSGPVSETRVFTGSRDSSARICGHGPAQVDLDDVVVEVLVGDLGQVVRGVGLQLLEEDAVGGDLGQRLTVGGAGDGDGDRAGRAVPGQADHADVVAEVLAAELRADAELLRQREHLGLQVQVAEGVTARLPVVGQAVEVLGRGVLRDLQGVLGAGPTHDDTRWYGGQAAVPRPRSFSSRNPRHRRRVEQRLGLLEQERLVRAAAALGHDQELVGELVAGLGVGVELDLGGQVRAGVALLPHRHRGSWE